MCISCEIDAHYPSSNELFSIAPRLLNGKNYMRIKYAAETTMMPPSAHMSRDNTEWLAVRQDGDSEACSVMKLHYFEKSPEILTLMETLRGSVPTKIVRCTTNDPQNSVGKRFWAPQRVPEFDLHRKIKIPKTSALESSHLPNMTLTHNDGTKVVWA